MTLCSDCGYTEKCPSCSIPLVLHKQNNSLRCHYCGKTRDLPEKCARCGSYNLELLGTGTEKMQEDIEELFGIEPVRFDSDEAKKKSDIARLLRSMSSNMTRAIIGTKMITGRIGIAQQFSLVVIMNIDTSMNFPDFRASEKVYRDISSVMQLVEPDGELLIQTRYPQNPLLKQFKLNNYPAFVQNELSLRRELGYPPYRKLVNITFRGNPGFADTIVTLVQDMNQPIEVLGPAVSRKIGKGSEYSLILKSSDRGVLKAAAERILHLAEKTRDLRISIDVDPV